MKKNKIHNTLKQEEGFTLLEVMIVILIIGLLTTIVAINVLPSQDRAMVEKAKADIALLEQAVEMYRLDLMTYPTTENGLEALVTAPQNLIQNDRYRKGGYIRRLPDDPWGNPYQYLYPGENGTFDIYTLGADGQAGGTDLGQDIGNWK